MEPLAEHAVLGEALRDDFEEVAGEEVRDPGQPRVRGLGDDDVIELLAAPEGEYALLLGAPDETAPRYELERVRDVVLAVDAAGVETAALQDNPDFSLGARLHGRGTAQRVLLWVVLIGAVVLLGALTLRLARREPAA